LHLSESRGEVAKYDSDRKTANGAASVTVIFMRSLILSLLLAPCSVLLAAEPLKALLITGGCCHDYTKQHEVIAKGIQSRANVQVDVIWTDDKSTNPPLPVYDKAD
jgi:hypothetical protein